MTKEQLDEIKARWDEVEDEEIYYDPHLADKFITKLNGYIVQLLAEVERLQESIDTMKHSGWERGE
jgi:hypothetical protein